VPEVEKAKTKWIAWETLQLVVEMRLLKVQKDNQKVPKTIKKQT